MVDIEREILLVSIEGDDQSLMQSQVQIDAELERVNSDLESIAVEATKQDYALSVASGILAGAVDALYVGETSPFSDATDARGKANEKVNRFIQGYAKFRGYEGQRLDGAISHLENKFKVAQDNVWKNAGIHVYTKDHHLADLAHHPTPLGLASAIVVRFLRFGTFVNREGKWELLPVYTSAEELREILVPVCIAGTLNWLVDIAQTAYANGHDEEMPDAVIKLARIVSSAPLLIEVARCADNWFGHLVSDMGGSKKTAGGGMGIPGVFLSLLYEIASLPGINQTGLLQRLEVAYVKERFDLRHELVAVEAIGKQAVPVMLNEVLVRAMYFVSRLVSECKNYERSGAMDWDKVLPFGNRTIRRMMTVASMTLTIADTADAAVRASIESAGNFVVFSQKFVARYNFIAAGRAVVSIVQEASDEARERELLHERRLLMEAKTELVLPQIEMYMIGLEERLNEYLVADLKSFFQGFSLIDQGLQQGDSNLVIAGNTVIQETLGARPQFTNQDEFDALMVSDEDFEF